MVSTRYFADKPSATAFAKEEKTMRRPAWKFIDSRGIEQIGYVDRTSDFGGTDVVYTFRDVAGGIHVLGGHRLRGAEPLHKSLEFPDR
jgi:hypothetical protein